MNDLLIIFLMLLLSAFFSGMEIAFITANKLKIEVDKNKGSFAANILSNFSKKPWKFIGALLLGNNIALVIYGIVIARVLEPNIIAALPDNFHSNSLILLIQTIIATLIILITAEFLPKILFRINANFTLRFFAVPAIIFYYLLFPITYLFISFSEFLLKRLFKVKFNHQNQVFTPIDVDNFLSEFSKDNSENNEIQQEIEMFQNAIEFRDLKLRECMIPRTEIVATDIKTSINDLIQLFIKTKLSKVLIFEDSIDVIIGYVHSHDMLSKPQNIKSILKPILIVPETMLAHKLLSGFIEQRKNVAIVVDEYGGTSGMLTLEDVIEEIFGEINDEYDTEDHTEKQISDHEFIFSGRLEIDYLNDKYQLNLPKTDDYETLAGLIIHTHESIPELNDEIIIGDFMFIILEASENRIEKVNLRINAE
ncbi:MAG: hemolysin family protein [Bacteroidetes bacterium]|nr:hemolysin family protein [Bacteroidota bacterium]